MVITIVFFPECIRIIYKSAKGSYLKMKPKLMICFRAYDNLVKYKNTNSLWYGKLRIANLRESP